MPNLVSHNLEKTKIMLEARGDEPEIPIKTLPELNRKLWGLHSKKLTIIGGRTSQGKSAMLLQLAWDTASQGIPTLFLSLEMYEEDIIERLFCLTQKIDNYELLRGNFSLYQKDWEDFETELDGVPLVIVDMLGKSWNEIDAYLQTLTVKPKVIFIDHLQEARSALLRDQKEIIDEYLKKMRTMAIREDFSLIIGCQINRASQENSSGNEPQLHHLKNSGYIEESADTIVLLHWPWHYTKTGDKNKFVLNVAKNRNGRTGWIDIRYKPESYFFYEETAFVPAPDYTDG